VAFSAPNKPVAEHKEEADAHPDFEAFWRVWNKLKRQTLCQFGMDLKASLGTFEPIQRIQQRHARLAESIAVTGGFVDLADSESNSVRRNSRLIDHLEIPAEVR
jgi:hypothetical protein